MKNSIQQYLNALQSGNAEYMMRLFSEDAIVHSPLYGELHAKDFFNNLFADTNQSKIILLTFFESPDNPDTCAAYFTYEWSLKNGIATRFDCVDLFQFNTHGKINKLTIIYDTYQIRDKLGSAITSTKK